MHEFSLVRMLLAQVAEVMSSHRAESVERIRVEMGPLSGAEPELVSMAFDQLVEDSPCRGATLMIERVPLSCRCGGCDSEFDLIGCRFQCPYCNSCSVQVTRGDEFRLLDVTIHSEREPAYSPVTRNVP